jgi:hypothetical protein
MSIRLTLYRRSTGPPTSSPAQRKYNAHVGAHVHPAHLVQAQHRPTHLLPYTTQVRIPTEFYNLIIKLTLKSILLPEAPLLIKLPELFLLILLPELFLSFLLPGLVLLILLPELFL